MPEMNEYQKHLLQARKDFLNGEAVSASRVLGVYNRASNDLTGIIKGLKPRTASREYMIALRDSLDEVVQKMNEDTLQIIRNGYSMALDTSFRSSRFIAVKTLEQFIDPFDIEDMFVNINEQAMLSLLSRTTHGMKLSDRVWRIGDNYRREVQIAVENGLARGLDSRKLAKEVQDYLKPGVASPHKARVRKNLGISKDVSYQAMRLARTEINNAFHEGTIMSSQACPSYLGSKWNLSASHPQTDICNDYATHDGTGIWPKGEEPSKPHPQCLCYLTPEHEDIDEFITKVKRWSSNPAGNKKMEGWYKDTYCPMTKTDYVAPEKRPKVSKKAADKKVTIDENALMKEWIEQGLFGSIRKFQQTGQGTPKIREMAEAVEEYIQKHSTRQDMLYRGMRLSDAEFKSLKVGEEFVERGTSSWTTDPMVADSFAGEAVGKSKRVILKVENAQGADISIFGSYAQKDSEVLLSKDCKFIIKSIKTSGDGTRYITVEQQLGGFDLKAFRQEMLAITDDSIRYEAIMKKAEEMIKESLKAEEMISRVRMVKVDSTRDVVINGKYIGGFDSVIEDKIAEFAKLTDINEQLKWLDSQTEFIKSSKSGSFNMRSVLAQFVSKAKAQITGARSSKLPSILVKHENRADIKNLMTPKYTLDRGTPMKMREADMFQDQVDLANDFFYNYISEYSAPAERIEMTIMPRGERAYAMGKNIWISVDDNFDVIVHEWGHIIHSRGISNKIKNFVTSFYDRRTHGEVPSVIYRGTDEKGCKDKFFNHYCGRWYGWERSDDHGQEILSMGLQRMSKDFEKFYLDDPEYFTLIYAIMRGMVP